MTEPQPYRIVLNGGDSDTVELELPDLREQIDYYGTNYTLRRDDAGQASRDVFGRYRYFWLWPKPDIDSVRLAGHTTTDRQAPHPPEARR